MEPEYMPDRARRPDPTAEGQCDLADAVGGSQPLDGVALQIAPECQVRRVIDYQPGGPTKEGDVSATIGTARSLPVQPSGSLPNNAFSYAEEKTPLPTS